ncbi:MAG: O-antigen ligase family protein [Ilumatobacteraceae bacterium]
MSTVQIERRADRRRHQLVTTWHDRRLQRTPIACWLPLVLVVAAEYKLRRRPPEDTLNGSLDLFILIELAAFAAVAAILLWRWRPRMRRHVVMIWIAGYCLTTAISSLYAPDPMLAMVRGFELVVMLLAVIQFDLDGDLAMMRRFLHGLVVVTVVSIGIGVLYVAPVLPSQAGRFTWLYTHSVTTGAMMAASTVVLFGMWLTHPAARLPWRRWVYGALLVVTMTGLLFNRTRGSLGGAVLAMLVMSFLWARTRGKRDLIVVGAVVVVGVGLTVFKPLLDYALRGADAENLTSFNNRTMVWSIGGDIAIHRPLHGMGFTASRSVFLVDTGLGGAHNAYLNVMVDAGLIGMFWWLGIIGLIVAGVIKLRRRARRFAEASPLTFDTITILGLMICQLINAFTAEMLGAGVSLSAVLLFLSGVWLVQCEDQMDIVEREVVAA